MKNNIISKEVESQIIIFEKKKNAVTTSRNVALKFNKKHDYVLRSIKNLDCTENFHSSNFAESKYQDSRGKTQPEYLMTREGFMFLVMKFTGKEANLLKEAFINRFKKMEEFIKHKQSIEYIEARKDSKDLHKLTMEYVEEVVEYAAKNGSANFKRYYGNYTRLANKTVGIKSGQKDLIDTRTLIIYTKVLEYIRKVIKREMPKSTHYKDIYKKCRIGLESMEEFFREEV